MFNPAGTSIHDLYNLQEIPERPEHGHMFFEQQDYSDEFLRRRPPGMAAFFHVKEESLRQKSN
jgi:hypothetical protein